LILTLWCEEPCAYTHDGDDDEANKDAVAVAAVSIPYLRPEHTAS